MKVSELIQELSNAQEAYGDLEVTITDGWNVLCYRTNEEYPTFAVEHYEYKDEEYIDIGIGGCMEGDL